MLSEPDFIAKKIIMVSPKDGDIISFKNDNIIVKDSNNTIKLQLSCYKLFAILIVGGFTITTGIVERSKRFGFSILLFTYSFKLYEIINFKMEGNTLLRKRQYTSQRRDEIGKQIIINKIENQRDMIKKIRNIENTESILILDKNILNLVKNQFNNYEIMGIEGIASKVYFKKIFDNWDWKGRQPRVKRDKINLLLDIGYTILFNYIEAILNIYGFDIYVGNLHREFYKRKSLVCDIIEPFRPIVDYKIRKAYNLGQLNYEYTENRGQYNINWEDSSKFVMLILEEIIQNRVVIFRYIQQYYRWIMKDKDIKEFPKARFNYNDNN